MFVKGFLVGFFLCAPMGPIGLFCIRKSLVEGRLAGLAAFLGASTVDGLFCGIAGLGAAYIVDFLKHQQTWSFMILKLIRRFIIRESIHQGQSQTVKLQKAWLKPYI